MALFRPHPARPRFPSDVMGHMMIGAFMPDCKPAIIRVAASVKNAGGVTDRLRA